MEGKLILHLLNAAGYRQSLIGNRENGSSRVGRLAKNTGLTLAVLFFASCAGAAEIGVAEATQHAAWLPELSPDAKILAFGDSLTLGSGGSGESYPRRLAQLIGREVVNAGVPGETSAEGLARLGSTLHEVKPGLLILCFGINDFLHGIPHDELRANLKSMLAEAAAAGVPVLLLGVPVPNTRQLDTWLLELAQPGSVRVEAHAMADVLRQPALKADLVHPNADGYRQVASAVAGSLRESGALARDIHR